MVVVERRGCRKCVHLRNSFLVEDARVRESGYLCRILVGLVIHVEQIVPGEKIGKIKLYVGQSVRSSRCEKLSYSEVIRRNGEALHESGSPPVDRRSIVCGI